MPIIAIYDHYVFRCEPGRKFNSISGNIKTEYLENFNKADINKIYNKYKKKFPNDSVQMFKHPTKPLKRIYREAIEAYMSIDSNFRVIAREDKINILVS